MSVVGPVLTGDDQGRASLVGEHRVSEHGYS